MKAKILVVDDNQEIADVLGLILDIEGYAVISASNGQETIDKVKEFKPNLILLDYLLPDIDGNRVAKKIKRNEHKDSYHTPIIMISASPEARKAARDVPVEGFIEKPFEIDTVINEVQKHIKKRVN